MDVFFGVLSPEHIGFLRLGALRMHKDKVWLLYRRA